MEVAVLPSCRRSKVARLVTDAGELERATADQAVIASLSDEVDASRGDVIAAASPA